MEIIWVSLLGALLTIDSSLAFQILISQPLIACTILGWMLGDIQTGLHFGFLMQMIWLGNMPVGASSVPEGNLASMAGVPVYLTLLHLYPGHGDITLILVILYVLLLSAFGARLVIWIRLKSVLLMDWAVKLCHDGKLWGVSFITMISLLLNFTLFSIFLFIGIHAGVFLGKMIIGLIPVSFDKIAKFTEIAIIGVGIGTVIPLFKGRRSRHLILAGVVSGIIIFYIL